MPPTTRWHIDMPLSAFLKVERTSRFRRQLFIEIKRADAIHTLAPFERFNQLAEVRLIVDDGHEALGVNSLPADPPVTHDQQA